MMSGSFTISCQNINFSKNKIYYTFNFPEYSQLKHFLFKFRIRSFVYKENKFDILNVN